MLVADNDLRLEAMLPNLHNGMRWCCSMRCGTVEQNAYAGPPTAEEVQARVFAGVLGPLELYNRGLTLGYSGMAVRNRIDAFYQLKSRLSVTLAGQASTPTIGGILARHGLTDGPTDCHKGDDLEWALATSTRPKRSKQGV